MGPDVRMGRRHAHWRWSGLINIETVAEIIGLTWQCADGGKGDLGQSLFCWNWEWRKRDLSGRMQAASTRESRESNNNPAGD